MPLSKIQAINGQVTPNLGRRNMIINGGVQVSQRGSVNGIVMSGATNVYTAADMWAIGRANVGDTGTLDTSVTGGVLRVDVATADTSLTSGSATSIRQIIEAQNCVHASGQTVTLSFKFKTNKTGTYGVYLYGFDAASYGTPQSITVSAADTLTSYTLTFTAPSSIARDTGQGIGVNITLAADSTREGAWYPTGETQVNFMDAGANYCELSEVQLEVGDTATDFEHRSFGEELSLCERYFQTYSNRVWQGTNEHAANYFMYFDGVFRQKMRAAPTATIVGTVTLARPQVAVTQRPTQIQGLSDEGFTKASWATSGTYGGQLGSHGDAYYRMAVGAGPANQLQFSAEL